MDVSQAEAAKYITQLMHDWARTVPTNVSSVVERILADDLSWEHDGPRDKAYAIEEAKAGPGEWAHLRVHNVDVSFNSDTATAEGSQTWTKTNGERGRLQFKVIWRNRKNQWQVVHYEDVDVPLID